MIFKTTMAKVIAAVLGVAVVVFGVTAAVIISKNNSNHSQTVYKKNNKDKSDNNGSKDNGGNSSDISEESKIPESPASDFEYTIENGEVTITKYIGSDTQVRIPEKIEGKSVTEIGNETFCYCNNLKNVTIPSSVTRIGNSAFDICKRLTDINVSINNPLYSSQDGVLFNKDKTTLICCPAGKENTLYIIPNSVTEIGNDAFSECSNLTSVTIPAGVTKIGNDAFSECSSLTSVYIPDSVNEIGDYAFFSCTNLTSIDIQNGITEIGNETFCYCNNLKSVTIPSSVTRIGNYAFAVCKSLTDINVNSDNPLFSSQDGVLFNKDKTTLICYPAGKENTLYSIPNSLTEIGNYAFLSCKNLTIATIPAGVTKIGKYAFNECSSGLIIKGKAGSAAEAYANDNGFKFVTD